MSIQPSSFAKAFEKFYKKQTGQTVVVDIGGDLKNKRPDFTAVDIGRKLYIVEIKSSGHKFDDEDWKRLVNYLVIFDDFFEENQEYKSQFQNGYEVILVADGVKFKDPVSKSHYKSRCDDRSITQITWNDFLLKAEKAHEELLKISEAASELIR